MGGIEQLTKDTQCESQSGAVNGDDNEKGKREMSKSGDKECREKSEMVQKIDGKIYQILPTVLENMSQLNMMVNRTHVMLKMQAKEMYMLNACIEQENKLQNCFYWPKKIKHKCWYHIDNILAIISEPIKIQGSFSHFEIDTEIWNSVTKDK